MKTICLYFEIHQIIHLKRYRCFDIGRDHYYYDDYENERSITDIAERSYIPSLTALIDMAKAIVDNPDAVVVEEEINGDNVEFTLSVAEDDTGMVIGRHGRIAKAIRQVMKAAANTCGKHVTVEIK